MAEPDGLHRVVYCVVPRALTELLHEPLREHFRDDPDIEVVVDSRKRERRSGLRRRITRAVHDAVEERRLVRSEEGRRVGERRALTMPVTPPPLPGDVEPFRERLTFVQRLVPSGQRCEDAELARIVLRFQAGDKKSFEELYLRTFSSLYSYLRLLLKDAHEAEDATQHVMINVLQALPRYQLRAGTPFRGWLFRVARNEALTRLKRRSRIDLEEPERMAALRESSGESQPQHLEWLTDADLMRFVERLPLAQRQAIALRYMVDLSSDEIGTVLDRSAGAVRHLEMRALQTLEERLESIGRRPLRDERPNMDRRERRSPVLRARRHALRRT
jgi:RNA polymerase sigma-70 factor (ECF subfamily)